MEKPYQWLRYVCRSRRGGQTEEDVQQEIFDMRLKGSTRRHLSGCLRATLPPPLWQTRKWSDDHFLVFLRHISEIFCRIFPASLSCPLDTTNTPFVIYGENRFSIIPFYRYLIQDFYRAKKRITIYRGRPSSPRSSRSIVIIVLFISQCFNRVHVRCPPRRV